MKTFAHLALFVSALASSSLGAAGCATESDSGPAGANSSLSRQSFCAKTVCEKIHDDCMSYLDECFGQCYGMGPEFAYQCVSVCNNYQCTPCTVNECDEHGYKFEIVAPPDPKVSDACGRYEAKAAQCGADTSRIICDRFSRLERPEAAAAYDCYASLPCGSEGSSCEPPATDWGTNFCLALNATCGFFDMGCTVEQMAEARSAAAWLKDDVRAEAMRCLEEPLCSDVSRCTTAWFETVFP
ncbi:MAG: hypothetical protein IPM35_14505 [Myxococcales bacterium]|nr:hypothetical protein [Myxococcales bacterium]